MLFAGWGFRREGFDQRFQGPCYQYILDSHAVGFHLL